ncbi:T9SS type A sorting domain-containing protein [Ginsengibacter hankyongi]|uniref:T9SS type A sorting domain-containing protein n=1 Tax=Ginsengibacter hankyongi TaxID=2607284 RepID=A0A5J5II03_9BACT|nr:PKD domain-containing protein [Ginsengibacter hankyongi]KAA9039313.1 T9SS type A sorting domain-containing protein [Ginsengibacter hankyongi]
MKSKLLLVVFTTLCFAANATTYYISASGNDANNGTSTSTPWKSLNKLNSYFSLLLPGDNILFNRGDVFYGNITVNASGKAGLPLTISAYGTGANPVITGFTNVTAWTNLGGNIWESTNAISTLSTCNMVVINGVNTPMGRWPNTGWLTYESFSSSTSITSSSLNSSAINWTGATAVIKKERYIFTKPTITSATGGTLNFASDGHNGRANWGFFIQNDSRTLDMQNEWYYNPSTKKIRVYSTSIPVKVQLAGVEALVTAINVSYIAFDGIDFTGANTEAFYVGNFANCKIINCSFNFNFQALQGKALGGSSANLLINNNTFNHTNNNCIEYGTEFTNSTVTNNTIKNTSVFEGMMGSGQSGWGISVTSSNTLIENNEVDTSGYIAIGFNCTDNSPNRVKNNYVNYFCFLKDDGGGIYSGNAQKNQIIDSNIIVNGIGNNTGTTSTNFSAVGIYCDDNSSGFYLRNNTVANCNTGIYLHNANNIAVTYNNIYDCGLGLFVSNDNISFFTTNIYSHQNTIIAKTTGADFTPQDQRTVCFATIHTSGNDIRNFGDIDSNYYARPIDDNLTIRYTLYGAADNDANLTMWQTYSGFDVHSHKSPKTITDLNDLLFSYNSRLVNNTSTLNATYIDVKNISYPGTITLPPYSSAVLIKNGATINQPPLANAGQDQTITLPTNSLTLSGSGTDSDGTISSYQWTKISGPSSYSILNFTSPGTSITGLVQGIYHFQLTVTDNNGATGIDTMQVTVNPAPNQPPVTNAGSDQTITLPLNAVTLTGSGSDPDGTISSYQWTLISGPSGYNIVNANSSGTDVTGLVQGTYQFQLTVTDNNGATATDVVLVTVNAALNISPIANAGSDQTVTLPTNTITLSGSGSDTDGTVVSYIWTEVSGSSGYNIVNANAPGTDVTGLVQGTYQFQLTVTDNNGAIGTDIMQVTVNSAPNISPVANAGTDQTITLPANTLTLSGSGSDADGTVVNYAWTVISGPSSYNIVNANSPGTDVTGLVQGTYQFQLAVTDNNGAIGTDIIQVTVNAAPNQPPVANAGPDQTITLPTNTITLSGSGSDADGTVVSYVWTVISGPSGYNIVNLNSPVTDVTGLLQGVYKFQLEVTDNNGATATDITLVTVNAAPNISPVANAGMDQIITLPVDTITLSGSGSDADGTISSYQWTEISGPSSYNIVNANSPGTEVTGLVQGTYQFQLTVTDNNGAIGTDIMQLTANAAGNISPVANAGMDQIITLPVDTITLSGSGSDADGTVVSYVWTAISGPSGYNIVNANSPGTEVTGLVQGTYQFRLTVTDNNGAIGTDIMQLTVNPAPNQPPVANAGTDQTITLPTNTVTLSGSGSDSDGTVVSYTWTEISGPSSYNIVNANSPSTDVTGLAQGIYQFQLTVTDNIGATATDIVSITVNPVPNQPPVASAGIDQTITLPTNTVTLSGSGSDSDGTVVSYAWTMISGPSSYNIVNANSPSTDVTGLVQGVYQFQLTVIDNSGATATDIVSITVNAAANIPPVANAGIDQTITLPTNTVTLSGSGSDSDGTVVSYTWTEISGPSGYNIVNPNSSFTDVTGLVEGVYQFQLQVTDNNGAIGTDIVQVTVNAVTNIPPVANAGLDQTITLPADSVTFSGIGSDADGVVVSYAWSKISGPSAYTIVNPALPSTNVTGLIQGVYLFELQVTDDNGATSADTIQVTVNAATNIPPVANAGSDQTITLPTNSVTLFGNGSDADGSIVGYNWTKISGPSGYTIINATSASTDVTGLVQGLYQFRLKVTDNNGATGTDTIQVTVNISGNVSPVANAGSDQTITLPTDSVTLSGSGTDTDGTIVGYTWTQISGPSSYNILNATSSSTSVTGLVQGVYQFQLEVTDNSGATGTDIVRVIVNAPPNISPVANAGADQTIKLPVNSVTLSGSGTDSDGTVVSYEWTEISGPSSYNIVNATSAATDITGLVKGIYKFQLKVTDNDGATGTDIVKITVNGSGNIVPVANAGSDQSITLPGNTITLSGSGTDADGSVVSYNWTLMSGPSGYNIVNANLPATDITGLVEGVYQFQLKVTDNKGAIGTDIVQVTVNSAPNQPPVANAGSDESITLPTNSVTLSGSGTDADGSVVSYKWTLISGPSGYSIINANLPATDVTGLVEGVYQFELTVTDNSGAIGTDVIEVTVNAAPNTPPVANAGLDQIITLPTNTVKFSGSGSDVDGSVVSYKWTLISGPSGYNIVNANLPATDVTGLVEGIYQFELTVTDNSGAIGTDVIQVTVNAMPNQLPVANAGPDQIITLPTNSLTLSGSGSDADGTGVSYQWTKISGPASYNILNGTLANSDVNNLVQGIYQFELKVTDNNGATATDIMQVIVNAAPNQPPLANAGSDQIITLPTNSLTLSGSGSDADGTIVSYQWTKISGPASYNILNATPATVDVNNLVQGIYQFELKVTDNNGATATDIMQLTVNAAPNQPPVANAGSDQIITLPTNSSTLSGSGSDADGTVVSYKWTKISGPSSYSIKDSTSAITAINSLVEGVYQFELTVTDNDGAIAIDEVQVTVNAAPNIPPVANAGTDKIITLPTNLVTISGSGNDADGTIVSYQWTKISGPANYNILDATTATIDINSLVEGVYQFQLKVTDNKGASATDIMQVTVNAAPNVPPVANAGPDQIITLPANTLTISGSGSDADGTVVGYLWTKVSGPANYNVVNPTSSVTGINGLVQGVYQFQLKITDNKGATSTDIMQVIVNAAANKAPVANAGADKSITLPTNSLTVSGSGSDADGIVASYQWSKISGPTSYNIVNPTSAVTDINGLVQGVYQFELRVTDNNGARGRDTVQITVNAAVNIPPIAHAGPDITITLPVNTASLAGSGSDADGTVVSYVWTKISGPSTYNIINASSPVTDVWGLLKGVYKFEIIVTDNKGATSRDTMQITVNSATNIAPVANAGKDQTITLPTNSVSLTGSGTDADGTIVGYSWKQISGPSASVIASTNSAKTSANGLVGGTYEFELTVIDNLGAVGKDTVAIVVAEPRLNLNVQTNTLMACPNPVIDETTLEIKTSQVYSKLLLIVTDMNGKIVYKKEITGGQTELKEKLNMSNLIKGTYAITIYYSDKEKQSIKVIRL